MKRWAIALLATATFLLLHQVVADADSDEECTPEVQLEGQTCAWIEECNGVPACASSCVLNSLSMDSTTRLRNRQYGEGSWQMCPELALWVNLTRPGDKRSSSVRKLLEEQDDLRARSLVQRYFAQQKSHEEAVAALHSVSSISAMDDKRSTDTSMSRQLSQFLDTGSGDSVGTTEDDNSAGDPLEEDVPEELTLECPSDELMDSSAAYLIEIGLLFENIMTEYIETGQLSADATDFDVVSDPNKWLVLMEYFLDPAKLKAYMQANCMDKLEPFGYGQINAGSFYVKTNLTELDTDTKLKLCVDKNRAWEDHHLGYPRISNECKPAFDSECYVSTLWLNVVDDAECAAEYSTMYNVSDPSIVTQLAEVNQQAHLACGQLETKETCTVNPPQEVKDLQQRSAALLSSIPFRSNHHLAEPMYEAQLVPFPGEGLAANSTAGEAQAPEQGVQDDGQAAAPTADRSFGEDPDGSTRASNEDGDVTPLQQEDDDGDLNVGLVVGPIAAAVVVVLLGVLAAVFIQKRRAKQRKHAAIAGAGANAYQKDPSAAGAANSMHGGYGAAHPRETTVGTNMSLQAETWQNQSSFFSAPSMHGPPMPHGAAPSMHSMPSMQSVPSIRGSLPDATDVSSCYGAPSTVNGGSMHPAPMHHASQAPPMPGINGPAQTNSHVCQALDFMHANKHALVERYDLMGSDHRSFGSFGVVQIATVKRMPDAVAIKIFTDPAGFANEERAFGIKALAEAVGTTPTFMKNEDRSAVMPNGWPFPPFTVAEKGQPLDVWMRSYSADPITSMQVLGQVLKSVKALHEEGYAHRNIKPSNIVQRDKQHDWMLSDFAASCPVGAMAPLPSNVSSLAYTAPEVLASIGPSNPPSARASAEADMWALGVVAFELLTNERAFPPGTAPQVIHAALGGQAPLPWEDGAPGAEERREKLRGLRRLVMPCLARDPAQRPSAKTVLHSWHNMFDDMKTRGTFDSDGAQHGESTRDTAP